MSLQTSQRIRLPPSLLSQSQSHITTESQSASPSWCQAPIWDPRPIFFLLEIVFRPLRVCYFVAPSLTRGWVCNLLLLLVLGSAVLLESEFSGTQDHILLSQFLRLTQPGGPNPCIYIPQEQGGLDTPPGTGFLLRRLLRLAGLRWRYFNPPPQGIHLGSEGISNQIRGKQKELSISI
jgi:hypothetical protein